MSYTTWINLWTGVLPEAEKKQYGIIGRKEYKFIKLAMDTCIEQFYYEGIEDTFGLNSQIIELALFFFPNLCFYKYNNQIVLCRYIPSKALNIYNKPTMVKVEALNGMKISNDNYIPYEDIVPIRDNEMDMPIIMCIWDYIKQLVIADKTYDINMINLRMPFVMYGSKDNKTQAKAIYQEIENFTPVIFTSDKSMVDGTVGTFHNPNYVNPIDTYDSIKELITQMLRSIGIYSDTGKRERLLVSEVQTQNDLVDTIYQARLRNRKEAIDKCNAKFGTHIVLKELYKDVMLQNIKYQTMAQYNPTSNNDNESESDSE